jgi:hypothetical protein
MKLAGFGGFTEKTITWMMPLLRVFYHGSSQLPGI